MLTGMIYDTAKIHIRYGRSKKTKKQNKKHANEIQERARLNTNAVKVHI